ncbi:helix-turn-helix transcriptional regulator [Photobacterium damselae]
MSLLINNVETNLLRLPQAIKLTGLSRATFYRQVKEGLLPRQIHLGPQSVAWLSHELEAVMLARICGYDDNALQDLVKEVMNQRRTAMEEQL